ncbi:MAG TPA: ATP-binding protein [Blastocatellia bacterium]|nr:ATP-binding protein [Blastocatellia bacterium]
MIYQWRIKRNRISRLRAAAALLGYTPPAVGFSRDEWVELIHPEDRARAQERVSAAMERSDESYQVEYRLRHRSGEYQTVCEVGWIDRDEDGRARRVSCRVTEFAEQSDQRVRPILEALQREQTARAVAEANARAKDEFLAVVSHELRTPLSAMLGWAEVLRSRRPGDPIYERALQTIERNAELQSKLIEDLLDTARILSGKLSIEAQPLYLDAILEESLDVVRPTAEAKDIELLVTFDSAPGPILGDANRLQQVFWNLLSNAIKFTEPGGRVEARMERCEAEVRITVNDTGKGITADFLPYVFDPFRQADSSSARRQGGLGLGLALARRLVEMHGGAIKAESAGEGRGATFTVTLPTRSGSRAISEMHSIALSKPPDAGDQPNLAGLRILVVDDEADARDLLAIRLQQYGAGVVTAHSAEAAMEALTAQERRIDVIVSDIAMPGEDGYSLIRRVRAMEPEQGARIPAIALTAYSRTKDRVQALAAGFQIHLPKPVNAAELAHAIAGIIGRFGH